MMQRSMLFLAVAIAMVMAACGGKKHDAAYYEQMVDSIRKAEQVKELQRQAGTAADADPLKQWFDSLQLRTLPIRNAGDDLAGLGDFERVPPLVCEHFGYDGADDIRAVVMPKKYVFNVVMMAEVKDSVNTVLDLYSLDKQLVPLDKLRIYEKKEERQPDDDNGYTYMEYYVTNNYEITLMLYFQTLLREEKAKLLNVRRYTINREGRFEELVIMH